MRADVWKIIAKRINEPRRPFRGGVFLNTEEESLKYMDILNENKNGITVCPTIALRGMTVLPGMVIHFDLSRDKSKRAVEQAMRADQKIFLVPQIDIDENDPDYDEVYHTGCFARIKQVTKLPENLMRVLVEGIGRGALKGFSEENNRYLIGIIEEITGKEHLRENIVVEITEEETEGDPDRLIEEAVEAANTHEEAMVRSLREIFIEYAAHFPRVGKAMGRRFEGKVGFGTLMDDCAANMPIPFEKKQAVLQAAELETRYEVLCRILYEEIQVAEIRAELNEKVKAKIDKNQKDYMLREQMNYIREELGESNVVGDAQQFADDCDRLKASREVKDKIRKEIVRFKNLQQGSAEASVERGYIETLLELPWDKVSRDNTDIRRAESILERDHYGLEQVKERILEFLAVRCLTKQGDSPIICLVGPPGTGKTSIARSVAESLNKKYVRISLGGVRDEAEIRGHRKTYVGAMPGRIVAGLKQAGVKNPLMLLDEIDKVSSDYKGDTSAALLEVLDSEQNCSFRDHYVEIPVDLSEVLFIATANDAANIPKPLLDRMEIIEVTSYTANEKFHIAKDHLLPKQLKKNGLDGGELVISDSALKAVIEFYTAEAGVRSLERRIGEICRKAARKILEVRTETGRAEKRTAEAAKKAEGRIQVTAGNLEKYLGKPRRARDKANEKDDIGIVRGLAWTSVGGVTMPVEVNKMPGKGELKLTGQLGDVMKESAMAGISYIRSVAEQYHIPEQTFRETDFHIHIPEGAVPKDGPSAGITMAAALLSVLTETPVKATVAMTGEITLRGRVLAIGGLKEKMLAAKMAGMKTVIVPKQNEKDVEEISKEIKSGLTIVLAETMEDVLAHAFAEKER